MHQNLLLYLKVIIFKFCSDVFIKLSSTKKQKKSPILFIYEKHITQMESQRKILDSSDMSYQQVSNYIKLHNALALAVSSLKTQGSVNPVKILGLKAGPNLLRSVALLFVTILLTTHTIILQFSTFRQ